MNTLDEQRSDKLADIWEHLLKIYSSENALKWLKTPSPVLGQATPLAVMGDDGGLDRVLTTVLRMSWGIPS